MAQALKDGNAAVALRVIKSLQQIAGQSNLFSGTAGRPIVEAMRAADRTVRFEAAFTIAAALPKQIFPGQESVVPVLAEAIAQNGKGNILVVADENALTQLTSGLKDAGYGVAGASAPEAAVTAAATLPTVDVILVSDALKVSDVDQLFLLVSQSPRLVGAARIVLAKNPAASAFTPRMADDAQLSVIAAAEKVADLKLAIEVARKKCNGLPMDEKLATEYALRAIDLLGMLAISHGHVLDVNAAEGALLASLDDARPEIVKAAAKVLGTVNFKLAQSVLLSKAADEKTADDVKISLYKGLSGNAKFFGNTLDASALETLRKAVESEKNLDVRSAAAEACGSLNLAVDQAKSLIANQPK